MDADYFYCDQSEHAFKAPGDCPNGHPTTQEVGCLNCSQYVTPNSKGGCPICSGATVTLNVCTTQHQYNNAGNCNVCGKALLPHVVNHYYCDKPVHKANASGPCPICGKAFKAWHSQMGCKLTSLSASGGATPIPSSSGALFENTGSISVYPPQDVPEAETVP